jgi:hypothetical protein
MLSVGYNTYCCFGDPSGIKFSQDSSKELGVEKDTHFSSFEDCKEIVSKHHNVSVSKLEIHHGAQRS